MGLSASVVRLLAFCLAACPVQVPAQAGDAGERFEDPPAWLGTDEAFLEQMAARDGAWSSRSGLVLLEFAAGTGARPRPSDTVAVHYRGMLPDGTVFDSSLGGEPLSFPLEEVIDCWIEGLRRMRVGGSARLVCPPQLAFGDTAVDDVIPPGATLVFDIELIGVE